MPNQWLVKKPGRRRRHFQQIPAKGLSPSFAVEPSAAFRIAGRLTFLATTEAAAGTALVRASSIAFHGRTLRLHAELGQWIPVVIDAPRRTEGFQFSAGDVAHISLRRGANCPMLPS